MKNLFKSVMPTAAAAVVAIAGAFATTSMQSVSSKNSATIQFGYIPDSNGKCISNETPCSDIPKLQMCRLNDLTGPVAYENDEQGNCVAPLYRVVNGQ